MLGTAVTQAQEFSEIKFENGRLTLTDDICCGFSLSPDKTPKAPKTPQATKDDKKKSGVAATKAGVPKSPIFNDKAAMLPATKDEDNWFIEVPDSILGRMLLTVTRFTSTASADSLFRENFRQWQRCTAATPESHVYTRRHHRRHI